MQVIYIDVLLLENALLNLLILYLVKRISRIERNNLYIAIASIVGALYVFIVFFPELKVFYSFTMKIAVSILMILIAFWPKDFKSFIRQILIFYGIAFFLGGSILSIFYLTNKNVGVNNGVLVLNRLSSRYLILGIIIGILMVKVAFDFVDRYFDIKNNTIDLGIVNNDINKRLRALIDTGNSLKDPITGNPVVVVDMEYILDIIPDEILDIVKNKKDISNIENTDVVKRLRVIPYSALGVENGILMGYKVDFIYVYNKKNIGIIKNPILALYDKHLSSRGDYQAIAYPEIIKWGD